jgi:16S rRNA G966 N2-methylase RsmD
LTNNFTIIGGEYRSRKFSFPDVDTLRPSPNKVRETLFNWLQFETHKINFKGYTHTFKYTKVICITLKIRSKAEFMSK